MDSLKDESSFMLTGVGFCHPVAKWESCKATRNCCAKVCQVRAASLGASEVDGHSPGLTRRHPSKQGGHAAPVVEVMLVSHVFAARSPTHSASSSSGMFANGPSHGQRAISRPISCVYVAVACALGRLAFSLRTVAVLPRLARASCLSFTHDSQPVVERCGPNFKVFRPTSFYCADKGHFEWA